MASKIKVDQIDTTLGSGNVTIDPDNNTLVVDTDNSRVGIGINSPTQPLHVEGAVRSHISSATQNFIATTSGGGGFNIEPDDYSAANPVWKIRSYSNEDISVVIGGVERARFLNSGGLTFNGDTAAANALDDYEEGTFTPTAEDESDNVGSAGEATGYYRKIGGLVHVEIRFTNINTTGLTSSEDIVIGGLPFTHSARNGSVFAVSGNVYHSSLNLDFSGNIIALLGEGQDFIKLVEMNDSGGDHDIQVADLTSGVADILMSLTYHTEQ